MTSWQELGLIINRKWKRERLSGLNNLGGFSFCLPFLREYQHTECDMSYNLSAQTYCMKLRLALLQRKGKNILQHLGG